MMKELNNNNFHETIAQNDKPVIVDFWAEWCGPCRAYSPIVEELSNKRNDFVFGSLNVENEKEIADNYRIKTIPQLIVFKNGENVGKLLGAKPLGILEQELDEILSK